VDHHYYCEAGHLGSDCYVKVVTKTKQEIALAFVGSVVPDEPRFHNLAFSRAGQMYQQEILIGLQKAGLPASTIISVMPLASRRHSKSERLWVGASHARLSDGLSIKFLPFINSTPLKQISIGMGTIIELIQWGWQNRGNRFRVVYCYNLSVPPGLFIFIGARLIRAKVVVSLCDIDIPGETVPKSSYYKLDYWLQRKLIPHFNGHIVVSDAIARDFLPGRPYLRLEGGIKSEVFDRTRMKMESGSEHEEPFVITSAGRLDETNGIPELLDAFSMLSGERFRLRIAGWGPLDHLVRSAASKDQRIEFLGQISLERVFEAYHSSSILVNLRMTKTRNTKYFFPSKMMEYLASGVPVISTCTGHVEDEFGGFTYLLKEETPQALCQLIQHVAGLDPRDRLETGRRARAYMETHKTWKAQTEKLALFIRETVLHIEPSS
jgi:glycosyltransferase involved in cell wall biosynthesis